MLNRKSRHSKNKSVSFQVVENNFDDADKEGSNGSIIVEEGAD